MIKNIVLALVMAITVLSAMVEAGTLANTGVSAIRFLFVCYKASIWCNGLSQNSESWNNIEIFFGF